MARNRIIYQSQALFIGPNSTGYHLQTGYASASGPGQSADTAYGTGWRGVNTRPSDAALSANDGRLRSLVTPMQRIQTANFSFTMNREDIYEFGHLARLDSLVFETPTVSLDFSYYLNDGGNERKMGFNIPTNYLDTDSNSIAARRPTAALSNSFSTGDGAYSGYSALSGLIADTQGNNFYIVTTRDSVDVHNETVSTSTSNFDVIGVGNGFITDYTVEAAVGAIPTASVTIEAFNIRVQDNISGSDSTAPYLPYINLTDGTKNTTKQFVVQGSDALSTLVMNTTGTDGTISALRPGDITFSMSNSGNYDGFADMSGDGEAHLQSVTINVPMSRSVLQRLGNTFGYARVIDLPFNIEISMSVVVSELNKNNLFDKLSSNRTHDFTLTLYGFNPSTGLPTSDYKLQYIFKNARLDTESFSSSIGDSTTADMTFSCSVGGANDSTNGVFMNGSYQRFRTLTYFPMGADKSADKSYGGNPFVSTNHQEFDNSPV